MFLHQLKFLDAAAARVALAAHGFEDEGHWRWHGHVIAPQRAVLARASYDEEGNETAPEQLAPGYWLAIVQPERNAGLMGLDACQFVSSVGGGVEFQRAGVVLSSPVIEPWPAGFAPPVLP